jgi:hypothetical protein
MLLLAFAMVAGIVTLDSCQSTKTSTASKMLKFNFEKGKSYDYEMIMNMDQEVMGQKIKMDMTMYYTLDVKEAEGDTKIITSTYDRFKMAMDMGSMMSIDMDTDKPLVESEGTDPRKDPMKMVNRLFSAIKGRQFQLKVNAEGKVLEVTGMQELASSIIDSMGLDQDAPEMKEKMREAFSKQFNDADVKSQFERILYIFPNKEVKVGDSWEKNTSMSGQMPAKYNSTYTVKEIEGDMVTLEENSKITSSNEKMEMDGKVKGTLIVDSRSGLVVSADQNMNITAKMQGTSFDIKAVTKVKGKAH